jgi:hypothetical protein
LVNASQLNLLTWDIGIIEWQAEGADLEWKNRLCRSFSGVSWSVSPNVAINCIFKIDSNGDMDTAVQWLFDNEILYASAIPLEPSMTYDSEYVLYTDRYDNGHTVFDGFLMGNGVLYWASIDVGTPEGYTPEMIFANSGEEIEVLLHEMFMINMGRRKTDDIAVAALQAVLTEIPEGDIPASRLNSLCWYASLWHLAEDALFACELAVEMEPEDGAIRDTRGLARALTGDFAGAIEDFRFFITAGADQNVPASVTAQRAEWVEALEAGVNPFDQALINELRSE